MLDTITKPIGNNFASFANENLDQKLLADFSMAQHKDYFSSVAESLQHFQLDSIESDGPDVFYVNLKSTRGGDVKQFLIEFNPNAPCGLVGIQESQYVSYEGIQIQDLNLLHRSLEKLADDNTFSGNLLIEKDGRTVFSKAYGYAEKRFDVKNTLSTRFNLASISKDFVSISILQLIQQNKLQLGDSIGRYIPELPKEKGEFITIAHLLRHRSGLGNYFFNSLYQEKKFEMTNIEDYIEVIADEELKFEPGDAEDYSNSGFELLAVIVQRVSGMTFYEYVEQNIFTVAGMRTSTYIQPTLVQKNLAKNYTNLSPLGPETEYVRENLYMFPSIGSASGGAIGTLDDCLLYTSPSPRDS